VMPCTYRQRDVELSVMQRLQAGSTISFVRVWQMYPLLTQAVRLLLLLPCDCHNHNHSRLLQTPQSQSQGNVRERRCRV